MSEEKRFRYGIWAVVFFVLAVTIPGWFVQMRVLQKLGRLEQRVTELESQIAVSTGTSDQRERPFSAER